MLRYRSILQRLDHVTVPGYSANQKWSLLTFCLETIREIHMLDVHVFTVQDC